MIKTGTIHLKGAFLPFRWMVPVFEDLVTAAGQRKAIAVPTIYWQRRSVVSLELCFKPLS
ncbi:hypothetical protein BKP35_03805 [Anaerobacillus arseniciselenatis]|uniref:Uncharacterized protein n=1 Tax=Anaerobacillus arseniciselenatis TaxID=85682 RepID=A0A1S2LUA4_9BACI|nr:hypothetical protein BKP35_03805 [Anaerobacillus arseniciselenatis]